MSEIKDGSVVEIINISPKQIESIRSQQCDTTINTSDIIGQRYYAKLNDVDNRFGDVELIGWNWGGHFNGWFYSTQLRVVNDLSNKPDKI